jgi:hypothetical protein
MAQSEKRGSWRGHVGWLAGQLIVVFAGVSAAFVVENYRDSKNQQAEFRQALSGVIAELNRMRHGDWSSRMVSTPRFPHGNRQTAAERELSRATIGFRVHRIPHRPHGLRWCRPAWPV